MSTAVTDKRWRAPQEAVEALLAGRHGDPFALLGLHEVGGGYAVRAFVPHAETVEIVPEDGGPPVALERRHDAGFFEGRVEGRTAPFAYTLVARNAGGGWTLGDPYRFGPTLGPLDDHLLVEGTHRRLHERLGAHACVHGGVEGTRFAVWAPNAQRVSVVGDFNHWDTRVHPMRKRVDSGLWEIFLPGVAPGAPYKYAILSPEGEQLPLKADPYGRQAEMRPSTASVVPREDHFAWSDDAFLKRRARFQGRRAPVSIYEVHAPSWRRHPDGRFYSWDELSETLIPHVVWMGFTHIELMPVMEHPLDLSWGYQPIGMHAPTARMGDPDGLKRFIDRAHAAGLGVLLDWVPAHFPQDQHGLIRFDGRPLYEHADPRRGQHREWGTAVYDYGRREVAAFLASNALYWLRDFHADGLRVDAVSAMIWLDHGRAPGDWAPNEDGSTENREAMAFLRQVNTLVEQDAPGASMMAEEATSFPGVTRPVAEGGLGFRYKWNMGWMNDTLRYIKLDPVHRRWHHQLMNFGLMYAFTEDFVLPISHDEVVHGKGTLLGRIPGDEWQRFATMRAYFAFMWGYPGKKLLFMGGELGQYREWSEEREPDWSLLQHPNHQGLQRCVRDLNGLYRNLPGLHARDCEPEGFRWIDADDAAQSTLSWIRFGGPRDLPVAVVCNFTPVPRHNLRIGLPRAGRWREVLNTDAPVYGGSGMGNLGEVIAVEEPAFGQPASATMVLPPLATVYLVPEAPPEPERARRAP
jgi:1,4-alpha-glucan branching enzyme